MTYFQNIWNIDDNGGNSNIDIIKNHQGDISIYKQYPNFSVKEIKKYQNIQNNVVIKPDLLELDGNITLLGNLINKISIKILKISDDKVNEAYDIKSKKKVTISNPDYVEGIGTLNNYFKNIEYQKSKKIKKLIENSLVGDNLYYLFGGGEFVLPQLSTFNIKVIEIKNGEMKLLITDIAKKIEEMIKKDK